MDSNVDPDAVGNFSTTICTKPPSQQFMRTASRIALHWMREDISQESHSLGPGSTQLHQDFFVLNACQVFVKLKAPATLNNAGWLFLSPQRKREIIGSIPVTVPYGAHTAPYNFDVYDRHGFDGTAKARAVEILYLIIAKKEMGIIVSELAAAVGRLAHEKCTLQRHMELMIEGQLVLRVGVVAARYVAMQHALAWVVQSFKLSRNGREKLEPFSRPKQQKLDQVIDAAAPHIDAAEPVIDAAEPVIDAAAPDIDAAEPVIDAAAPDIDAAEPVVDADDGSAVPDTSTENETVEGTRKRRKITTANTQQIAKTVDSLGEKYEVHFCWFHFYFDSGVRQVSQKKA